MKRDDRWYLKKALERLVKYAGRNKRGMWIVRGEDLEFAQDVLSTLVDDGGKKVSAQKSKVDCNKKGG